MMTAIRVRAPAHARSSEAGVALVIWSQIKVGTPACGPLNGFALMDCDRNVVSRSGAVSPETRATAKIVPVTTFPQAPLNTWLPFSIEATAAQLTYKFDKASGVVVKPAMDGSNRLALAPGSKLRDVRLTLLGE